MVLHRGLEACLVFAEPFLIRPLPHWATLGLAMCKAQAVSSQCPGGLPRTTGRKGHWFIKQLFVGSLLCFSV